MECGGRECTPVQDADLLSLLLLATSHPPYVALPPLPSNLGFGPRPAPLYLPIKSFIPSHNCKHCKSTTPKFTFLIQISLSSKLERSVVHLTFHLHLNASQAPQTYIEFRTYLPAHKTHFPIFLMIPRTTQLLKPKS